MALQTRGAALLLSLYTMLTGMFGGLFPSNDPSDLLALVNRDHMLSKSYAPETTVLPQIPTPAGKELAIYLRPEAAAAIEALFTDAAMAGHRLYGVSGYRSYNTQYTLFEGKKAAVGEKRAMLTVAPPGASEHQLGLAIDINGETTVNEGLTEAFGASPEGLWVYANAHRFGFIIRYAQDKTDITGYAWEPWHLRYVGVEVATELYESGDTFEEYHHALQTARVSAWLGEEEE